MKKYIPLEALNPFVKKRKLEVFLDKVSFRVLFLTWFIIILFMGFVFYNFQTENTYLYHVQMQERPDLLDSIYYSFITATSTGYGDIIPYGFNKIFSIFEVILSLTIFALATSKLIGLKQETILSEIYEISFSEKINRIRNTLYLFRVDLNKVIFKVEENRLKKREVAELWTVFHFFENTIGEIRTLVAGKVDKDFIKRIDPVDLGLLLNGINLSISRIKDTLIVLNNSKYDWEKNITIKTIDKALSKTEKLFEKIDKLYDKAEIKSVIEEFKVKKNEVLNEMIDLEKLEG
ncbi:hypothetical protein C0585_08200 [Candidatus Woesearchaeota archaeon]|nr:MAG: hypothetical protein C0585_08200 [Candidatus Woesearchaeota archaeon]